MPGVEACSAMRVGRVLTIRMAEIGIVDEIQGEKHMLLQERSRKRQDRWVFRHVHSRLSK